VVSSKSYSLFLSEELAREASGWRPLDVTSVDPIRHDWLPGDGNQKTPMSSRSGNAGLEQCFRRYIYGVEVSLAKKRYMCRRSFRLNY
jgi:hypothetical protein